MPICGVPGDGAGPAASAVAAGGGWINCRPMSASGWGELPSGLVCSGLKMIDASAYSSWRIEPRRPKA
jgi:hypothetical protein